MHVPGLGKVTLTEGKIGFEIKESPCPGKLGPLESTGKACIGAVCVTPEGVIYQATGEVEHSEHGEETEKIASPSGKVGIKLDMVVWP